MDQVQEHFHCHRRQCELPTDAQDPQELEGGG